MYRIQLSHIFEVPSISNEKPLQKHLVLFIDSLHTSGGDLVNKQKHFVCINLSIHQHNVNNSGFHW